MLFIIYTIIAFLVVYFSIKCAYYLDIIEARTNLSGVFLSGIILAGITSLPELVTSVSAISYLDSPELVLGNILGSNIFNLTILGFLILAFFKTFLKNKVNAIHDKTLYCLIIIYTLLLLKMHFNLNTAIMSIDILSVIIVILYVISLKCISNSNGQEESQDLDSNENEENIKTIIIKFIFSSMCLVISSVAITVVTDKINNMTNIGATMAGALLLGIATSIPEMATCITLCRLGNFNSTFGNLIGSCIFNYIIIVIGDLLYVKGSIYIVDNNSYKLTIFGLVAIILTLIILKAKVKNEHLETNKLTYILSSIFIITSYFLFIFL